VPRSGASEAIPDPLDKRQRIGDEMTVTLMQVMAEIRERTPKPLRRDLVQVRHAWRARTSRMRRLPDVLIIGTQRGGTSSLYKYLGAHPSVAPSLRKETQYFTRRYGMGVAWYRVNFPLTIRGNVLTFEATPDYLFFPQAAARAAALVPDAKIIVLLRDPVQRAFSHHRYAMRLGIETLPFPEAIDVESGRLEPDIEAMTDDPSFDPKAFRNFSYVSRGFYADQLERWFEWYPRDRFLFIKSEAFFADPSSTYGAVLDFLGLRQWRPRTFVNQSHPRGQTMSADLDDATRARLMRVFEPHNRRLADLLGPAFTWI
jgi:hypothetical protein